VPFTHHIERSLSVLNVSCCFITCRSKEISVVSLYRSPSTDITSALHNFNHVLSTLSLCTQHIIAGDFNIELLKDSVSATGLSDHRVQSVDFLVSMQRLVFTY